MIDIRQLRDIARTLVPERPDEAALIRDAAFEIATLRAMLRSAMRDGALGVDGHDAQPEPAPMPMNTELYPPCYGVAAISRSSACPRCGATENDLCGDFAARDFQEAALKSAEADIVLRDALEPTP